MFLRDAINCLNRNCYALSGVFNEKGLIIVLLSILSGHAPEIAAQGTASILEEVIVTVQRRSEDLQSVPLSVSAFSGSYLEDANVTNVVDLEERVPGLVFEEFAPGQPRYSIRGIGSTLRAPGVDANVGVFIDDVYMSRPEMTTPDLFDLDRAEVLRGPQGTLFGRNVVGGALVFHTQKPNEEFSLRAQGTVGNEGLYEARAAVNGPLSDNLFGKLTLSHRHHNGYAENTLTGNDVEDERASSIRGALRYVPNDDLEMQINADYSLREGTGRWWHLGIEGPNAQGFSNPDPRRGDNPEDGYGDVENWGISLSVNWQTALGSVTSITAYREAELDTRANTTGLVVPPVNAPIFVKFTNPNTLFIQESQQDTELFTQELRLASDTGGSLSWLAGIYYLNENIDHRPRRVTRFTLFPFPVGSESDGGVMADLSSESIAMYGNVRYDFSERFNLQVGIRWSEDEKDQIVETFGTNFVGFRDASVFVAGWTSALVKESWDAFTPSASLNFNVTGDAMLYATVSRGFKSGGFNDLDPDRVSAETPFSPEFVWNYEMGLKSEWLDRRLRLNVSGFFMDYKDLQVSVLTQPNPNLPALRLTDNAGTVDITGVELEWNFIPVENLNIYGNFTYLDSEVKDTNITAAGVVTELPTPDNKFFVGASYAFPIGNLGMTTLRFEYIHIASYFNNIANRPIELIGSKDVYDASILFESNDGHWSLQLWGKNLSDGLNINSVTEVPVRDGYMTFDPPQTYGVTLGYNY